MTNAEATLRAHLLKHPLDTSAHLALSEAIADAGDERAAILYRIIHDAGSDDWRLQYATLLEREIPELVPCPECKGKGKVFLHAAGAGGAWRKCDTCKGTGTVIDTSHTDRAEFIRCQVELARTGRTACVRPIPPGPGAAGNPHRVDCRRCAWCVPKYEASKLLAANRTRWLPPCPVCSYNRPGGDAKLRRDLCGHCKGQGHAGELHRGFLVSVEVPTLADVFQTLRLCAVCAKSNYPSDGELNRFNYCARCDSTRTPAMTTTLTRPTKFARDLFRGEWATCERVVVKDREPHLVAGLFYTWYDGRGVHVPGNGHHIPAVLWDAMPKSPSTQYNIHLCGFPTAELANSALATALCDTLRALCAGET